MVPGWVPFKIVSDSSALHSRWLLLLKIEISSIVHCCFSFKSKWAQIVYCSYIARGRLTYIPGFSVKFFLQPIFTDYRRCLAVIGHSFNKYILKWQIQYGIFNYLSFIEMFLSDDGHRKTIDIIDSKLAWKSAVNVLLHRLFRWWSPIEIWQTIDIYIVRN